MSTQRLIWRMTRSGTTVPEAANVVQRAKPFGAAVTQLGGATILAVLGQSEVSSFLLTPAGRRRGESSRKAASQLANAVGARAVLAEAMPDLSGSPVIGQLVARPHQVASRDSQSGADPTEVARLVARVALPGSWVAASMRPPTARELNLTRGWYRHRLAAQTHHTNEGEALLVSLRAGGRTGEEVRSLLTQVAAALPGFDIEYRARLFSRTTPMSLTGPGRAGLVGGAGVRGQGLEPGDRGVRGTGAGLPGGGGRRDPERGQLGAPPS